jgi:putative acetyltransferase
MLNTPQFMREMKRGEEADVNALLDAAFGGPQARLTVEKLRSSKAIAGEMILPMTGNVVGFAALSNAPSPKGWLLLEPVAILPEFQARGFGKRLIGMIAQWAEMTGNTIVTRQSHLHAQSSLFINCGFTPLNEDFDSPQNKDTLLICGAGKTKTQKLTFPKAIRV